MFKECNVLYVIAYVDETGMEKDCYPDFCYSLTEARRIAPEFMQEFNWIHGYRIYQHHDYELDDREFLYESSVPVHESHYIHWLRDMGRCISPNAG